MRREFISIPEIIIKNQIPQEIVYKTLVAIPHNYGSTPGEGMMVVFYCEKEVTRKNELQTYSKAILDIYKSSYLSTFVNDQIKVFKTIKIENIRVSEAHTVLNSMIKNGFDFFKRDCGIQLQA